MITSFYGCAGERCLSGSVLVPVGDVYKDLKEKFVAAAKALKVGNGLEEGIQMGPVVSKKHMEKVLGYIEKGIKEGAKLILDGRNIKVDGHPNGFYIGPTVFDEVHPDMTIAKEEIFGPVVSIVHVKNFDEGLKLLDNSEYGNALSLYHQREDGPGVQIPRRPACWDQSRNAAPCRSFLCGSQGVFLATSRGMEGVFHSLLIRKS
jgi:malonate-semialdehyde dehydrogenase (acetylating)/methylmalonate-semialdehyde dehydrogenase